MPRPKYPPQDVSTVGPWTIGEEIAPLDPEDPQWDNCKLDRMTEEEVEKGEEGEEPSSLKDKDKCTIMSTIIHHSNIIHHSLNNINTQLKLVSWEWLEWKSQTETDRAP